MPITAEVADGIQILQERLRLEVDPGERKLVLARFNNVLYEAGKQDPWLFMRYCLRTHDEHGGEQVYKPFPDKEYLRHLVREWERIDQLEEMSKRILFVWKSRKMMVSWAAVAMNLWTAMFREGQLLGWQSQKAEDADKMLTKVAGLHERMQASGFPVPRIERKFLELKFPETNSLIMAVPAGDDQVRQFTWSVLTSDEVAFQDGARASYVAAMPAVEGGGMYVGISSAGPGHFEQMVTAKQVPGTHRLLMPGMEAWENDQGVNVIKLLYPADEEKTNEWAEKASLKYPGGRAGADWRAEMEGEFGARAGTLVFPDFSVSTHVIEPFDVPEDAPKWRVFDWGYEAPAACLWFTYLDEKVIVYREHYQSGWEVSAHAQQIIGLSGKENYVCSLIDSAAFTHTAGKAHKSVGDLFADHRLFFVPVKKSQQKRMMIPPLAELIKIGERGSAFKIFNTCQNLIHELLNWRWQKQSADMAERHGPKERPVDKDDHAIDCCIYWACNVGVQQARQQAGASVVYDDWRPGPMIRRFRDEQMARSRRQSRFIGGDDE